MKPQVTVIIPVYNEERTVGSVVEIARTWEPASEVIVINDGSTDKSLAALKRFGNEIKIISYKKNRGKGHALAKGIQAAGNELLLFLDSDLVGLTHNDLDVLISPMLDGSCDMALGSVRLWGSAGETKLGDRLTGERAVWKSAVKDSVSAMEKVGYGIELFLNDIHKKKKVAIIPLPYVSIIGKFAKTSVPKAMRSYLREARELIAQTIKQQADDIPPPAKRIFLTLQAYLKQMVESI